MFQRKYRNQRVMNTKGTFDSKMEFGDYLWLESLLKAGKIIGLEKQVKFEIRMNGKLWRTHRVYFRVTLPDGRQKYVETKGFATEIWKQKRDAILLLYPEVIYLTNPTERELLA